MKAVLVIADGLGGRPTDLNGETCLEVADTPVLDRYAERGSVGLMDSIKPGVRPGSDTAHLSIFGYDPYSCYTGRGVFEAAGIGMDVERGDVCFRTNFATLDSEGKITDRRAGRIQEGQEKLEAALSDLGSELGGDVEVSFKTSTEHRGALLLRGKGLGDEVTDTDPHELGVKPPEARGLNGESEKTAGIVNELMEEAREILSAHPLNEKRKEKDKPPANALLCRGSAGYPEIPSVEEKYGIRASVTAAGALYIGVAKICGMEFVPAEGATGTLDSNIKNKVKVGLEELEKGKDLAFLHFKGTDNASHDHDSQGKIRFIEKIDSTLGFLEDKLDWTESSLAFAGDHTTPIESGDHVADPVPAVIRGPGVRKDGVRKFDEVSCNDGGLGRFSGQLLPMVLSYSDMGEKYGA